MSFLDDLAQYGAIAKRGREIQGEQLDLAKNRRSGMTQGQIAGLPTPEQDAAAKAETDARNKAIIDAFMQKNPNLPNVEQTKTNASLGIPSAIPNPPAYKSPIESWRAKPENLGRDPGLTVDEQLKIGRNYSYIHPKTGEPKEWWINPITQKASNTKTSADDIGPLTAAQVAVPAMLPAKQEAINSRQQSQQDFTRDQQWVNLKQDMNNDYRMKKLFDQGTAADMVNDLIGAVQNGNTTATSALGIKMAKTLGEVGVMTDSDVTKYITSKQLPQRLLDKLQLTIEGKPTDMTLGEIKEVADILNFAAQRYTQIVQNDYVKSGVANYGATPEESARRLNVPYHPQQQQQQTNAIANGAQAVKLPLSDLISKGLDAINNGKDKEAVKARIKSLYPEASAAIDQKIP